MVQRARQFIFQNDSYDHMVELIGRNIRQNMISVAGIYRHEVRIDARCLQQGSHQGYLIFAVTITVSEDGGRWMWTYSTYSDFDIDVSNILLHPGRNRPNFVERC